MRRWLLRVVAVLVTVTPGVAAVAQTNAVPPPVMRSEINQASVPTSAVLPAGTPMQGAIKAVKIVNSATGNIYRISSLAAPTEEVFKDAAQHQSLFRYTGYVLTGADAGIDVVNGRYGSAGKKVAAAVIDRCIDVGIKAACAWASAPTGELAAAPCVAAVSAAKFCAETYFGGSAGKGIVNAVVDGTDWVSDKVSQMRAARGASRSNQQSQFQSAQSNNDQAAMAIAANAQPSGGGDDGSAMMMAAMMSGVGAAIAANNPPPVPYRASAPAAAPAPVPYAAAPPAVPVATPSPAPTGCHPGHNESAHPGGCHSAPKGSSK